VNLYQALVRAVGSAAVITDPELTASYERDWSGRYRGRAKMVVRPGNTAEVAAGDRGVR
jgi:FAD/FMN-containing dehydrogenase